MKALLGALLFLPALAYAQGGLPSGTGAVVQIPGPQGPAGPAGPSACGVGDLDGNCLLKSTSPALTAVQSAIPSALGTTPPAATPSGAVGSPGTYTPGNAAPPSLTRSTTATTASDGTFSVTWATPLVSATPVVNIVPVNTTATQPVICNVTARSAANMSGKCWMLSSQSVALISLTVALQPSAASGIPVSVFAREPTQ